MTDGIEIVGLSAVDEAARAHFYERAFPDRARLLAQHWRWWYRVGFDAAVEPQVALDRGVMIGQAGVIPALLKVAGRVEPAQWYVDFAVLPEYQGKGVGHRLTEAWMKLGLTFITHCNDNSMRVFKKYGFVEHDETVRYARPIHPRRMFSAHPASWMRLGATVADPLPWLWAKASSLRAPALKPASIDLATAEIFGDASTGIVRDDAWVRWRLKDSPFRDQYSLFSHGGAHAVVRHFTYGGVRRVHLLWLTGDDARARRDLVSGVARWSLEVGSDLLWAATNRIDLDSSIRATLPFRKRFRFAYLSRDAAIFEQLRATPLGVQAIDSDTDSMYA